jgi:hypothetical protein
MRRVWKLALGGLVVALLAGCANPAGVDGDLTDDWPAAPEAKPFVPASGVCHGGFRPLTVVSSGAYFPIECTTQHGAETIHVGPFTGADADRATAPAHGSTTAATAFAECDAKAKEYIGGDWRAALIELDLVLPSPRAWEGGARWFRCDLRQVGSLDTGGVTRAAPLRDALKNEPKLRHGCYRPVLTADAKEVDVMQPVACNAPHRAEFAGIWTAPDTPYADFDKNTERLHAGCRAVIAAFAKVPNDSAIEYRTGTIAYSPDEEEWRGGDRGVQCFLWIADQDLRRSMKGAGPGVLRIR